MVKLPREQTYCWTNNTKRYPRRYFSGSFSSPSQTTPLISTRFLSFCRHLVNLTSTQVELCPNFAAKLPSHEKSKVAWESQIQFQTVTVFLFLLPSFPLKFFTTYLYFTGGGYRCVRGGKGTKKVLQLRMNAFELGTCCPTPCYFPKFKHFTKERRTRPI